MRWWLVGMGIVLGACGSESKTHDDVGSTGGVGVSVGAGGTAAPGGAGSGGASSGGTGAPGGAGSGGTGAGGDDACNAIEANAPLYPLLSVSGPPPAALGGTIVPGTYFVTSETQYESPPMATVYRRGVRIEIAEGSWQEADAPDPEEALGTTQRYTYAVSVESPRLTMTTTCPVQGDPLNHSYTVEPEGLTVYVLADDVTLGITLARQ